MQLYIFPSSVKTPIEPECRVDADCPSKLACINAQCQNPCAVNNPCSPSQECVVKDTIPSRSVACLCPDGTVSDDRGQCNRVTAVPECYTDNDCEIKEKCHQGSCIDACQLANCGSYAICVSNYHDHKCICPEGYLGNPQTACYPCKFSCILHRNVYFENIASKNSCACLLVVPQTEPTLAAGCANDDECPDHTACENRLCINPCAYRDPCARNAYCKVLGHKPVCTCPDGYIGDPRTECKLRKRP